MLTRKRSAGYHTARGPGSYSRPIPQYLVILEDGEVLPPSFLLLIVLILATVGMKSASDLPEKAFTSWSNQNAEYEEAVTGFARALLADGEFLADLKAFVGPLVEPGRSTRWRRP